MFSKDNDARRRIEELQEEFLKLRREFKSLEMEWANAYDKLTTMMQRVAKRAEVLQKEMDAGKPPLSAAEQVLQIGADLDPRTYGTLTARQRKLQSQILARRSQIIASASPRANGTED